jgi:hypothetical protein
MVAGSSMKWAKSSIDFLSVQKPLNFYAFKPFSRKRMNAFPVGVLLPRNLYRGHFRKIKTLTFSLLP